MKSKLLAPQRLLPILLLPPSLPLLTPDEVPVGHSLYFSNFPYVSPSTRFSVPFLTKRTSITSLYFKDSQTHLLQKVFLLNPSL